MPKQLQRHAFKKGAENPNFSGVPTGAGMKAWAGSGAVSRDKVKDWRDEY